MSSKKYNRKRSGQGLDLIETVQAKKRRKLNDDVDIDVECIIAISQVNDISDNDDIVYYQQEDEPLLYFLVKYYGKSHIHCDWVPFSSIKVDTKVIQKWRLKGRPSRYDEYSSSYFQIDRIINHQRKQYFIKWKGLSYDKCTWETAKHLNNFDKKMANKAIKKYNALKKLLKKRSMNTNDDNHDIPERPKVTDGHLSNLIPLNDGLSLKDYQREGVDWICFNWHENRVVYYYQMKWV